jgi:hypothetical protein
MWVVLCHNTTEEQDKVIRKDSRNFWFYYSNQFKGYCASFDEDTTLTKVFSFVHYLRQLVPCAALTVFEANRVSYFDDRVG